MATYTINIPSNIANDFSAAIKYKYGGIPIKDGTPIYTDKQWAILNIKKEIKSIYTYYKRAIRNNEIETLRNDIILDIETKGDTINIV